MNEAIQQIIEAVKQASPFLWHAAYRFVIVDALMGIAFGIFIMGGMAKLMLFLIKKYEDADGVFLCWIGLVASIVVSAIMIFINLQELFALDYYAIQALTRLAVK